MAAANPNRGRPRDREVIRDAIIAAARRVAARDGIGEVSLSRVASEANFAPGVVYGHFRSKNELLLSVVANDLSAMATEMRETGWPDDEDNSAAQVALPLEEPAAEQIPNTIAEAEHVAPLEGDIEPFAGNAGLTAVARALREPDEDAITSNEAPVEIHAAPEVVETRVIEDVPALEEVPIVEMEPVAEAEPVAEEQSAPVAKIWSGDTVLPEDDMDPFVVDDAPEQISLPTIPQLSPVFAETPVAEAPAVLPEDDVTPFIDVPAEIPGETVEPVAEAAPVEEEPTAEVETPALVEDPVLTAIDATQTEDDGKAADLAI